MASQACHEERRRIAVQPDRNNLYCPAHEEQFILARLSSASSASGMPGIQASKHAKGQHEYRESKQPNAVSATRNLKTRYRGSHKKFPSQRKGPRNLCLPAQDPAKEHLPQSSCVPGAIRDKHVEGSKLLNVNCEASQGPAKD